MSNEKINAVNEALKLPLNADYERDLAAAVENADGAGSVIITVIDVDHFMAVNTEFGHAIGDAVLIAIGNFLKSRLPANTDLYRNGGDEFTVIFAPDSSKEDAFLWAETTRAQYAAGKPHEHCTSLSFGVAAMPEDGGSPQELMRKAYGAMLRAKQLGGGRVCLAREEKMEIKTTHYTTNQLQRLTKLSKREGVGEAILLREALDMLLKKYDV